MKTIIALSACVLFAFCSSSKKTIPPTGVSNVKVGSGDTMTSAETASAKYGAGDRDYAYRANNPSELQGTWTLEGMATSSGTWSPTSDWYKDSTSTTATAMIDTAMSVTSDNNNGNGNTQATGSKTKGGKRGRGRASARRALYDSANARLKREFRTNYVLDTTVQPYKYWQRIPTITINTADQTFIGNSGCNSMSGDFKFDDKGFHVGRNISTSRMACNGYDESAFLSALKRADSYTLNGNTLELREGTTLLLTFRKG